MGWCQGQQRHTVPRMDSVRENSSGPSVGLFTTSQGVTPPAPNESFAVPGWLAGTHQYMKVFDIISRTTKSFLDSANLSDRLPLTNSSALPKQKFYNQFCHKLCKDNLYMSLSFKIAVHQPKNKRHWLGLELGLEQQEQQLWIQCGRCPSNQQFPPNHQEVFEGAISSTSVPRRLLEEATEHEDAEGPEDKGTATAGRISSNRTASEREPPPAERSKKESWSMKKEEALVSLLCTT